MYENCNYDFDDSANVSGIIFPYNNETISQFKIFPKEQIAASVFNQMLAVKKFMKKDLVVRPNCLP